MKRVIPQMYLDNCSEALEYYKGIFGGEIKNVQTADGKPMFKGLEGKIIHSELHINENYIIYMVDVIRQEQESIKSDLLIECESEEEINRIYNALSENGIVKFPLQKTFWGSLHAVLDDRYGNSWGLDCSVR